MYYSFKKHYRVYNMCLARAIDTGDIIVKTTDKNLYPHGRVFVGVGRDR